MKKLILSLTIGLVGMTTYAQTSPKDTTFLSIGDENVGFINRVYYTQNINGDGKFPVNEVTFTKPLTNRERSILEERVGEMGTIHYDFKLPSDYLRQSSIYRDNAIKTRIITGLIGTSLGIIGGIIAGTPSYSTTTTYVDLPKYDSWGNYIGMQSTPITTQTPNNTNRNMGLTISGLGAGVFIGGAIFSLKLDFDANDMLRRSADKFRTKGL